MTFASVQELIQGTRQVLDLNGGVRVKDPTALRSDPVQPIVFYISREVPEVWRPYIKQAIDDWQSVFAQAGFDHAIVARDAPSAMRKRSPISAQMALSRFSTWAMVRMIRTRSAPAPSPCTLSGEACHSRRMARIQSSSPRA